MIWFESELVGEEDVERSLDNLIRLLSPAGMAAFLQVNINPYLAKRAGDRFASEGDDVTGPWLPLKEATVLIRESQGYGAGPINHRTGELEEWVTQGGEAFPNGWGATLRYPKTKPTGELRKKVETAQKGRSNPNTPPRPVLGVNEADMLFYQTTLSLAITEAVKL